MSRLRALIRKECLQIIRDPSAILIAVFLPLLLLFLYGSGVSLDIKHLKIGLVLEESSPLSESFADALKDSSYFDVMVARDRQDLTSMLETGQIRGMVVIPSYFSEFLLQEGKSAPIQVIADGSEANTANFVQYYVRGAFLNWLAQEKLSLAARNSGLIRLQPRFWFNETLESRLFLLSGSLGIIMTLIGTLLTSLVMAREWERGTMEALISTPIQKGEMILGKTVPYFFLGLLSMFLSVFVATVIYGLPFRGSFFALLLITSSFLACTLGLGLLISLLCKVQILASQISIVIGFLPAYILSGFLFEISSMPVWIQYLTYLLPFRYFVQSIETVFIVGDVWSIFFKNISIILLMSIGLFFLIFKKIIKSIE